MIICNHRRSCSDPPRPLRPGRPEHERRSLQMIIQVRSLKAVPRGDPIMTAAKRDTPGRGTYQRRLVIVVRADPVICGHSGEARNLAEARSQRGFTDVRSSPGPSTGWIASGLPLKPLDGVLPYSEGIEVERPEPVGDYKVPDGRYLAGMTGRLVELFTDGVPTACMSLY